MKDVLFVCYANIGRSQVAEGIYNKYRPGKALSAGIADFRQKYNYTPHRYVIDAMREIDVDISKHKIKLLTKEMLDDAEKVVVFAEPDKWPDFLKNCRKAEYISVEDPGKDMNGPDDASPELLEKMRESVKKIHTLIKEMLSLTN